MKNERELPTYARLGRQIGHAATMEIVLGGEPISAEDAYGENLKNAFAIEDDCSRVIFRSEDAREGPRTFMERHAPRFIGRSCR